MVTPDGRVTGSKFVLPGVPLVWVTLRLEVAKPSMPSERLVPDCKMVREPPVWLASVTFPPVPFCVIEALPPVIVLTLAVFAEPV